jgi:hypothetical protein
MPTGLSSQSTMRSPHCFQPMDTGQMGVICPQLVPVFFQFRRCHEGPDFGHRS